MPRTVKALTADSPDELADKIQTALFAGWEALGGPYCGPSGFYRGKDGFKGPDIWKHVQIVTIE